MTEQPRANVERFTGFADRYDTHRPRPPAVLVDLLTQLAQVRRPRLVVDVGSGTGLSTRIWAGRAEKVIGMEPSADMRTRAEAATVSPEVTYLDGLSDCTGLPNACADVVTVSQALHWMEPEPTFAEVARILRPGGVFAAYDCDWPPAVHWEAEAAYRATMRRVRELEERHGITAKISRWEKEAHLERMRQSGRFRYTREVLLHHVESGSAERMIGLALSQGSIASLLKLGLSEEEIGLGELGTVARRTIGDEPIPWFFGYRVRIGLA